MTTPEPTFVHEPPLFYSQADSDAAYDGWEATCGPHSLAADVWAFAGVRPDASGQLQGLDETNAVEAVLKAVGARYHLRRIKSTDVKTLGNGINRIQFEGPWLKPGCAGAGGVFPYALGGAFPRLGDLHSGGLQLPVVPGDGLAGVDVARL